MTHSGDQSGGRWRRVGRLLFRRHTALQALVVACLLPVPVALASPPGLVDSLESASRAALDSEHVDLSLNRSDLDRRGMVREPVRNVAFIHDRRGIGTSAGVVTVPSTKARVRAASLAGDYDMPEAALAAYREAAATLARTDPSCRLDWALLAGIGRVESDHGRYAGTTVHADGTTSPHILGLPLDGSPGVAAISDSDGGALDGDTVWDRAVGPMQFIPTTWSTMAADGDGNGRSNPHDLDDAALAAGAYLCAGDSDLGTRSGAETAVFRYNHSDAYVALVLSLAEAYRSGVVAVPSAPASGEGSVRNLEQVPDADVNGERTGDRVEPRAAKRRQAPVPAPQTKKPERTTEQEAPTGPVTPEPKSASEAPDDRQPAEDDRAAKDDRAADQPKTGDRSDKGGAGEDTTGDGNGSTPDGDGSTPDGDGSTPDGDGGQTDDGQDKPQEGPPPDDSQEPERFAVVTGTLTDCGDDPVATWCVDGTAYGFGSAEHIEQNQVGNINGDDATESIKAELSTGPEVEMQVENATGDVYKINDIEYRSEDGTPNGTPVEQEDEQPSGDPADETENSDGEDTSPKDGPADGKDGSAEPLSGKFVQEASGDTDESMVWTFEGAEGVWTVTFAAPPEDPEPADFSGDGTAKSLEEELNDLVAQQTEVELNREESDGQWLLTSVALPGGEPVEFDRQVTAEPNDN